MRNSKGQFVKGHEFNLGKKCSPERYEKMKVLFFKENNKIRNTGRTQFKKGRISIISEETKRKISLANKKREDRNCALCNTGFSSKPCSLKKFCSKRCGLKNRYKNKIVIMNCCIQCKKETTNKQFCSNSCVGLSLRGREQKEEWINKQRVQMLGDKCWLWQGGKSFEPYLPEFNNLLKEQVRRRDNLSCQECGWTQKQLGYKLPVHHIDYNKKNNDKQNLISLCRSCHAQTNYDRDDWQEYFSRRLK